MHSTAQSAEHATQRITDRTPGPITRRLVCALALLPIVPAVSIIGVTAIDSTIGLGTVDEFRWFHLLFAALWVIATILIWRTAILWTLGRRWLTALVCLIPFVQVTHALPLWDSGCITDDILRAGQHQLGIGVFIWLSIWVWWGWEKRRMAHDIVAKQLMPKRMAPTARRLAASIGTIPVAFGCFLIVNVALDDIFDWSTQITLTLSYALTAIITTTIWTVIWRSAVTWSNLTIRRTVFATVLTLALPITATLLWQGPPEFLSVTLATLPVIGWGVWMAWTINIWPVGASESSAHDATPRCMKCGYPLIGLRATRCPECGDEPTLDELWQAMVEPGW